MAGPVVAPDAHAQSADTWVHRWAVAQHEASVTIARLQILERGTFSTDGAFGPREMEVVFDVTLQPSSDAVTRSVREIRTEGRVVEEGQGRGRRRFRSPIRRDLLRAADALLFPADLLRTLETRGSPEPDRVNGRESFRLVTVSPDEESAIERVVWHFARPSGRLLQARAIIRGEDRGTLVVEVEYVRHEGLDIPVSRAISGSYGVRRRTRTYTVLLESLSLFEFISVETL